MQLAKGTALPSETRRLEGCRPLGACRSSVESDLVRHVLHVFLAWQDKNDDPILGPDEKCVYWYGDVTKDDLQAIRQLQPLEFHVPARGSVCPRLPSAWSSQVNKANPPGPRNSMKSSWCEVSSKKSATHMAGDVRQSRACFHLRHR